jgi:nitroreductase
MPSTIKFGFLLLVLSQAAHSIEEYSHSLWEVLAPARIASNLIASDPAVGFIIINTALVLFAFWTYFCPVSRNWATARRFLWFWIVLELGNSVAHLMFALNARGYFPGIYTAPVLLAISCYLALKLLRERYEADR